MTVAEIIAKAVLTLALIAAYTALTLTGKDGNPILGVLVGVFGSVATTASVKAVQNGGNGNP